VQSFSLVYTQLKCLRLFAPFHVAREAQIRVAYGIVYLRKQSLTAAAAAYVSQVIKPAIPIVLSADSARVGDYD